MTFDIFQQESNADLTPNSSKEALDGEVSHGIDPWYELLKNLQQYPERDSFIPWNFFDGLEPFKGYWFVLCDLPGERE